MYLTRFRINTARIGARRLLSSPQVMHAAVMSSFAEIPESNADGPRILWRVDRDSSAATYLYIVSPARPDLTHLVEQVGWPQTGRWETFDYRPFLERLAKGDEWAFRLTAAASLLIAGILGAYNVVDYQSLDVVSTIQEALFGLPSASLPDALYFGAL